MKPQQRLRALAAVVGGCAVAGMGFFGLSTGVHSSLPDRDAARPALVAETPTDQSDATTDETTVERSGEVTSTTVSPPSFHPEVTATPPPPPTD